MDEAKTLPILLFPLRHPRQPRFNEKPGKSVDIGMQELKKMIGL